jgi:hypothetical protein
MRSAIKLYPWIVVLLLLVPSSAAAQTVRLAWDPSTNAAGYQVSWGTRPGSYSATANVGNQTYADVPGLVRGTQYYFAVRAYNWWGVLSTYSEEVSFMAGATIVARQNDLDLDRRSEIAVWREANGSWYMRNSSSGYTSGRSIQWGTVADIPVPGDYDGD